MSPRRLEEMRKRQRSRRNGQLARWLKEQQRIDALYAARRDAALLADVQAVEAAEGRDLRATTPCVDEAERIPHAYLRGEDT